MIKLKPTSQQAQRMIEAYNNAKHTSIYECYCNPSQKKRTAQALCFRMYNEENGERFRIIGAGTYTFSAGWKTANGIRYETAYNSYLIAI